MSHRPIAIAVSLLGLGLCLRAHATLDAEGPQWWREGLSASQAAAEAAHKGLLEIEADGMPGHALHTVGIVLLVVGGGVAVMRR